jgi:hypothetical protein
MMPKKAGDEVSGELLARGYWQVLGSNLTEQEMNDLTEMVLNRCKWFPTVAECREIMGESEYTNPFYISRMQARLEANGYGTPRLGDGTPKQITAVEPS